MNYVVTEPDPTRDRGEILTLWRRNLPEATAARYAWLYESGPATSWLATTPAGSAVGATGLMGRRMKLYDRVCEVGQAIDLNVDHEHRTIGPALKLQRALTGSLAARRIPLVYAMPVPQADAVMRRIGYKLLGTIDRWTKPLRSEYKLKNYLKFAWPTIGAAFVVDQALKLRSAERFHRRPDGCRTEVTQTFDRRFDDLWDVASRQFAIIGERSVAYLNWRYHACPEVQHRAFCVSDAAHPLLGYVVYHRDEQGFASVSDLLFSDESALDLLLAEFIHHARAERLNAIHFVYFGSRAVTDRLQRFGFFQRQSDRRLHVYLTQGSDDSDQAGILNRENWFLTRADADTDV